MHYNTGDGTYSLFDTTINGSDQYKQVTFNNIVRVPIGVTASFYMERWSTQTMAENIIGAVNIIEII
jgi:hypothetical protein